jgi:hypothetical protein
VATELLKAKEPEMVACIKEYKNATEEKPHYRPFDYMLNRILSLASRLEFHADAERPPPMTPPPPSVIKNFKARYPDAAYPPRYGKLSAQSKYEDTVANEGESVRDGLPSLVFVNSHNHRLDGCDAERQYVALAGMNLIDMALNSYYRARPDFVGILQALKNEINNLVDIHDAVYIIELKHDGVKKSRPPDLHDPASKIPLESTYARPQDENPNPRFKYLE